MMELELDLIQDATQPHYYEVIATGRGCVAILQLSPAQDRWFVRRPNGVPIGSYEFEAEIQDFYTAIREHYEAPERAAADAGYYAALTE